MRGCCQSARCVHWVSSEGRRRGYDYPCALIAVVCCGHLVQPGLSGIPRCQVVRCGDPTAVTPAGMSLYSESLEAAPLRGEGPQPCTTYLVSTCCSWFNNPPPHSAHASLLLGSLLGSIPATVPGSYRPGLAVPPACARFYNPAVAPALSSRLLSWAGITPAPGDSRVVILRGQGPGSWGWRARGQAQRSRFCAWVPASLPTSSPCARLTAQLELPYVPIWENGSRCSSVSQ